jgi:hypothetical protein
VEAFKFKLLQKTACSLLGVFWVNVAPTCSGMPYGSGEGINILENYEDYERFQVLVAASMKLRIFWDVDIQLRTRQCIPEDSELL